MKTFKILMALLLISFAAKAQQAGLDSLDRSILLSKGKSIRLNSADNAHYIKMYQSGTTPTITTDSSAVSFPNGISSSVTMSGGTINNAVIGGTTPAAVTATTLTANTSLTVGTGGFAVTRILSGALTYDFPNTSAQTSADSTAITVTGAGLDDYCVVGASGGAANTAFTCETTGANTAKIKFHNYSSGAVDPASRTFNVLVFH